MSRTVSEQVVLLGRWNALVGILARAAAEPTDRPAIVILNTGIIHRVGYNRMFVAMSRALATAGHTVLRFDFSGIGDSEPRREALAPVDACMADLRDVLDWLERTRQISRVILIGLCSGADHAVLYGHTDARIAGLVLLDPTIPTTLRHAMHFAVRRLMDPRTWRRLFTGRSRVFGMSWRLLRRMSRPGSRSRADPLQSIRSRRAIEQHYQASVARGIAMLAVFTGESTRQTYREQMIDAFPGVSFGDRLRLEYFPDSDHLFSLASNRAELTRLVLHWADGLDDSLATRQEAPRRDGRR